jgi:hypothetical protein
MFCPNIDWFPFIISKAMATSKMSSIVLQAVGYALRRGLLYKSPGNKVGNYS